MSADLPALTQFLITLARSPEVRAGFLAILAVAVGFGYGPAASRAGDAGRAAARAGAGAIWIMYQVGQFARVLSTLLVGGIPLVQALERPGVGQQPCGRLSTKPERW
jgi:type IV pilus assembly protein PilC